MLTIFTPTYNRAYILPQLYRSLVIQTDMSFEWIVVDDSSEDNTKNIVNKWMEDEHRFKIRYYRIPHGGKHRAINYAIKKADGEAFFIVDSDDELIHDAVAWVNYHWFEVKDRIDYAGISGLRINKRKTVSDEQLNLMNDYVDCSFYECDKYQLNGDKAEIYKTNILKKYSFPEIDNEYYISENVVWNNIAKAGFKMRWYRRPIYKCEYLNDGLTVNAIKVYSDNPRGWMLMINSMEIEQEKIKKYCYFYECEKEIISKDEIKKLPEIDLALFEQGVKLRDEILDVIKKTLIDNNIKTVAIYGMGVNGYRIFSYLKECDVKISYGIDNKRMVGFLPKIYTANDIKEKVDAVFVTPKCDNLDIGEQLKGNSFIGKVICLQNIRGFF